MDGENTREISFIANIMQATSTQRTGESARALMRSGYRLGFWGIVKLIVFGVATVASFWLGVVLLCELMDAVTDLALWAQGIVFVCLATLTAALFRFGCRKRSAMEGKSNEDMQKPRRPQTARLHRRRETVTVTPCGHAKSIDVSVLRRGDDMAKDTHTIGERSTYTP